MLDSVQGQGQQVVSVKCISVLNTSIACWTSVHGGIVVSVWA